MTKDLFKYIAIVMTSIAAAGCNPDGNEPEDQDDPPFTLKVYDISSVSATVEVEPLDQESAYYMDILSDKDYSQTVKYGFDDYMAWLLESLSEQNGKSTEEIVEMISSYGNDGFISTTLKPESKYYAVAVGIDEEGMTTTEVVAQEFTTLAIEESANKLDITVSGITASSATVSVTATNNDPYIVAIEPTSAIEGMSDSELIDYIIQSNLAWGGLEQMTYNGNMDIEHLGKAGWEYEVIAFGYTNGLTTTDVLRHRLNMEDGGDPSACTFEFTHDFDTFNMYLEAVPSDNSVVYVGNVISTSDLESLTEIEGSREDALKANLEMLIEEMIEDCGSRARVIDLISLMGPLDYSLKFEPETEYRQWVVAVDQNGNPVADFICSEPFMSPAEVMSDASLTLKEYTWYNGTELAELYPDKFKNAKGYAVVDMTVEASEASENWWSYVALEDLTDRSREVIIKNLLNAPTEACLTRQLVVAYWGVNTIMGIAQDAEGTYGPLLLEVVELTKDGAADAADFQM